MKKNKLSRRNIWWVLIGSLLLGVGSFLFLYWLDSYDHRVSHILNREGYASTESFAKLFCQDVEKAVRFSKLREELETDGQLDFDTEILDLAVGPNEYVSISLRNVIDNGEEMGLYFDENNRLVTRNGEIPETTEAEALGDLVVAAANLAIPDESGEDSTEAQAKVSEERSTVSGAGDIFEEEAEYYYQLSEEEYELFQEGQLLERKVLVRLLYDLADYYKLKDYLCPEDGETNFSYRFVFMDQDSVLHIEQNLKDSGNTEDILCLGAYFCMESDEENLVYNFHDDFVEDIYSAVVKGGLMEGEIYELAAGVDIDFPYNDQYYNGLKAYRYMSRAVWGLMAILLICAVSGLISSVALIAGAGTVSGSLDRWYTEPFLVLLWILAEFLLSSLLGIREAASYQDRTLLTFYCGACVILYPLMLNVIGALIRRKWGRQFLRRSILIRAALAIAGSCRNLFRSRQGGLWAAGFYLILNGACCLTIGICLGFKLSHPERNQPSVQTALIVSVALALVLIAAILTFAAKRVRVVSMISNALEQIRSGEVDTRLEEKDFRGHDLAIVKDINAIGEGMSRAVAEQTRSERMKTDLIANVSHDLRTPLTSIINYVELLKREPHESEKSIGYLEVLEKKTQRLQQLTEDLLEASRISSGNMPVNLQRIDLVEMICQMEGEFEERLKEAGLQVITNTDSGPLYVMADGRLLSRVLENLYNNVRKYAMRGTRVYVDLKLIGQEAVFTMKNISASPLNISAEELTERFVRGDSSRTTEGSGLGLSIAQNLTELMGGVFEIYLDGDLFRVAVRIPLSI